MKFFIVLFVLLCGCATDVAKVPNKVDLSLQGIQYYDDAGVVLSDVAEAVTPVSMPGDEPRVLMVPFAVRQDVGVRREIGQEMGDIFYRTWLGERVFGVMEYDTSRRWTGVKDALAYAKAKGANTLLIGNISHFMEGGGTGRTSIGLTVQLYWVPTGTLIWSAAQAGQMESAPSRDYVVIRTTRRLPEYPSYAVMQAISLNLAHAYVSHSED